MVSKNLKHKFSASQKRFILLSFTRELIRHSNKELILGNKLENKKSYQIKNVGSVYPRRENIDKRNKHINLISGIKVPKKRLDQSDKYSINKNPLSPHQNELVEALKFSDDKTLRRSQEFERTRYPPLRIPMQKLPPRFQYLKPIPTSVEVDIEKLNSLLKDPMVRIIECNGANKNIIVGGSMGRKKTSINLSRKEIEKVIYKFSEEAKIPVHDGIFKVVVGRFIFTAIVSEIVDSKFTIKKMDYFPKKV